MPCLPMEKTTKGMWNGLKGCVLRRHVLQGSNGSDYLKKNTMHLKTNKAEYQKMQKVIVYTQIYKELYIKTIKYISMNDQKRLRNNL